MTPRFLNILSVLALTWGIGVSASQTVSTASVTGSVYEQADASIQLASGVLFITLGFFLHALARMRNGERPVHITVKPKSKRRMWYWMEMRI